MFQRWPKRDPEKNYFMVPNEVFCLGLDYGEIAVYTYLLRCEDRETYQCYPSYRTIGKSVGMCENTVRKNTLSLEEKGLICTEPTMITTKDGRPRNGSLRYPIRPSQEALNSYYRRQLTQAEEAAAKARAEKQLAKLNDRKPSHIENEGVSA